MTAAVLSSLAALTAILAAYIALIQRDTARNRAANLLQSATAAWDDNDRLRAKWAHIGVRAWQRRALRVTGTRRLVWVVVDKGARWHQRRMSAS